MNQPDLVQVGATDADGVLRIPILKVVPSVHRWILPTDVATPIIQTISFSRAPAPFADAVLPLSKIRLGSKVGASAREIGEPPSTVSRSRDMIAPVSTLGNIRK